MITLQNPARFIDHTLLKADATERQIIQIAEEALEYGFYGVCVNSSFIPLVQKILKDSKSIPLAVVGFPLGAMSTKAKVHETKQAIDDGAKEIDMVISVGRVKETSSLLYVKEDIRSVVTAAGTVPVKVILETAYLNTEEIGLLTNYCAEVGVAFVKTSTGFASRGASEADIKTIRSNLEALGKFGQVQIKASGGIKTAADFKKYLSLGATRIGTSSGITIVNELNGQAPSKSVENSAY